MNKFNSLIKELLEEKYIHDVLNNQYDVRELEEWGKQITRILYLAAVIRQCMFLQHHSPKGPEKVRNILDTVQDTITDLPKELSYKKIEELDEIAGGLYKSMYPKVLSALTDLYETEYKLHHLTHTHYPNVNIPFNIGKVNVKLQEISEYIIKFLTISFQLPHLPYYFDGTPNTTYAPNTNLLDILLKDFVSESIMSDDEAPYRWDKENVARIFKYFKSNDIKDKITGITLMFNIIHDDSRRLILNTGEEEYSHLLIPVDEYERASQINERKVINELEKEIGYK